MDSAEALPEPAAERRLAAILAVDVAGYSASSERDEAGAVRAVQILTRRIEAAALAHGGRVFNTAGDGFMLEFPTVSGALAAAEQIVRGGDPPVRIGAHLGEVAVTGKGDLLGHGVNVAARLQALAKPGCVLVSDAVRRAVTGSETMRFKRQGRVRLDKMSQAAEVFTLDFGQAQGVRRKRPWLAPALAAIGALAVAAGGYLAWTLSQSRTLTVAVEPLQAAGGDPAARALVDGLAGRISAGLSDHGAPTVPEAAAASSGRGGARLVVGGEARRFGDTLSVDVRLDDRRGNRLLWSSRFERPVSEADALGDQIEAKVTDVVSVAVQTLNARDVDANPETLSAMLKLADLRRDGRLKSDQMVEIDRQFIQLAPRFAVAHASLAYDLVGILRGQPPQVADSMRAEIRRESAIALKLDPRNAEAYAAIYQLLPASAYMTREAMTLKVLALAPSQHSANVTNGYGDFLREVGRNREAEPLYRRGLALDPLSPPKTATSIFGLAGTGRADESWGLAQRALAMFPYGMSVRKAYVYTAVLYQPPERALKAIEVIDRMGGVLDDGGAQVWRAYVEGTRDGKRDAAAIRRLRDAALKGVVDPSNAAPALAKAGDVDGAFAVFNTALDQGLPIYPAELFENAAASMRADPRFMALAKRIGLLDYWRTSGHWPDYCAEPGAPDCKAMAAKYG